MQVLLTRPERQARATADRLTRCGHEVWVEPLLKIRHMQFALSETTRYAAVVVTSANGVGALEESGHWPALRELPFYCVGHRTASMARLAGVRSVISAGGDVGDLATCLRAAQLPQQSTILYAVGENRAGNLENTLDEGDPHLDMHIVYMAEPVQNLTQALATALRHGRIDCALAYSARSLTVLIKCCARAQVMNELKELTVIAISDQAAYPGRAADFANLVISEQPDEDSLLHKLTHLSDMASKQR
jgi:uroporphyrinogen-III synthase